MIAIRPLRPSNLNHSKTSAALNCTVAGTASVQHGTPLVDQHHAVGLVNIEGLVGFGAEAL
jgi:hypothetical protein